MHKTEYLNLKVAEENDFYNINENSENLEKIDKKFKDMEDPDIPNSLANQVSSVESPSFVNHDSDTIGSVPTCPVNSVNPPDVGEGNTPSGWKKVSALKAGEKLFSVLEKLSTTAYNVKWLFKWLNSINTIGEYTSVDSQGNIVKVKNNAKDTKTGVPFPFPIQTVVEGHEAALRQLNTETKNKLPKNMGIIGVAQYISKNFDDYGAEFGIWSCGNPNECINCPDPASVGVLISFASGIYTAQFYVTAIRLYHRTYISGSWRPWN